MRAARWRSLLGVALVSAAVVSCSSKNEAIFTKFCNLYPGMTREQVRETMGEPNKSNYFEDLWLFDSNNRRLSLGSNSSDKFAWKANVGYKDNVAEFTIAQDGLSVYIACSRE